MEFRYLVSFLALAEELHFGRAAAKLHLTQPSLSQQLQRLERRLGVTLVLRSSHEVRLTPAGEEFRDHAQDIVRRVERAAQAAREAADGRFGTLRVGYNFSSWQAVLPAALARMYERFPHIVVELSELRSGPQPDAVADGELDIAFGHGRPGTKGLRQRPLMRVPVVALVGALHPWARLPSVGFAELAGQRCVLFKREQSPVMYDAITATAERCGITLDVAHHMDDLSATSLVVATQQVVGFVSLHRGRHEAAGGLGLAAVPFHGPAPVMDLHAIWRTSDSPPAVNALLSCLDKRHPAQTA
ncbi:LysR family transcriptional regulator [Nonomuraea sp. NPDC050404]|uniref:LysR family transcriptional regulator n=1 Tax=Nonomuraea sp. NPDC050404 TaxID=3155783 RepID=UPI00340CDAA8